ncbi:MAG: PrsW family glutamic-type intramembrane protease [Lachnospira sp.]
MVQMIYLLFICIAVPMMLMLFLLEKQSRVTVGYMILGLVMCLFAGEVNAFLINLMRLDLLYATITLTPITEELLKSLPVLFYAFVISDKRERLLSLAMAHGIGFAILENAYIMTQNIENADFILALIRGFATGLMHGLCTAAVGYGISYVRKRKKLFYTGTFGLLTAAAIYHAIFNVLVQSPYQYIGFLLPMLTYIPIVIYINKTKKSINKVGKDK